MTFLNFSCGFRAIASFQPGVTKVVEGQALRVTIMFREKMCFSKVNDGGFGAFCVLAVNSACMRMHFSLNAEEALNGFPPSPPQIAPVSPQVIGLPW